MMTTCPLGAGRICLLVQLHGNNLFFFEGQCLHYADYAEHNTLVQSQLNAKNAKHMSLVDNDLFRFFICFVMDYSRPF